MLIDGALQESFATSQGDVFLSLWVEDDIKPTEVDLRIHKLLLHNNNLYRYLFYNHQRIEQYKIDMVFQMLHCVSEGLGGTTYWCEKCSEFRFIPFLCHTRVCCKCGKIYAEQWGREFMGIVFPKPHRHVIFTLPGPLWDLVMKHPRILLNAMLEAVKEVIFRVFKWKFKKKKVTPGTIAVVHFTGRDMKWNPHIHVLVTEGGLNKFGRWMGFSFFPYKNMNRYWKAEVLKRFRFQLRHDLNAKALIDRQWKYRLGDGTNGYVVKNYPNVMDGKNCNKKAKRLGSYLARYIRHPPVGESRLIGYDGKSIEVKYEWDNKLFKASITIENFINAIFYSIPPKGFKVVRRWGLYSSSMYRWANSCLHCVKFIIRTLDSFVEDLIESKSQVVRCRRCGEVMEPLVIEFLKGGKWGSKYL